MNDLWFALLTLQMMGSRFLRHRFGHGIADQTGEF